MRRKPIPLILLCLFICLVGAGGLWLRARQRQYTLNRQLIAALIHGDDRQALLLINEGADPNTRSKPTPVPSVLQLLKQMRHRSPSPVNDSPTALLIACGAWWNQDDATTNAQAHRPDAPQLVEAMLRHGAKVNMQDENKWTPLLWAVRDNRRNTAGVLLAHGADANAKDEDGCTPIMLATRSSPEDVRLLLDHGAHINAQDKYGRTPLMEAAYYHAAPDMVRLLLEHGANINMRDREDGFTALHWAVYYELSKDFIGQLLAHRADPNLADKNGKTPLMWAQETGHPDIVALLRKAGAGK